MESRSFFVPCTPTLHRFRVKKQLNDRGKPQNSARRTKIFWTSAEKKMFTIYDSHDYIQAFTRFTQNNYPKLTSTKQKCVSYNSKKNVYPISEINLKTIFQSFKFWKMV